MRSVFALSSLSLFLGLVIINLVELSQLREGTAVNINTSVSWTLAANILVTFCILLCAYYLHVRNHLKNERHAAALHAALDSKVSELKKLQTITSSILEDARSEKNHALELARENQALAAVVQQSNDAIVRLNSDGFILNSNRAARKLFAVADKVDSETHLLELFPNLQHGAIIDALEKLQSEKRPVQITLEEGNEVHELTFSSIRDDWQARPGIVVIIRDVSAIFQEQEQIRLVIEQAPTALVLVDELGIIRTANTAAEAMFGYARGELINLSIDKLTPREVHDRHPKMRAEFFSSPRARAMGAGRDLRGRRKNGDEISVEVGLNPISTREGQFVVASIVDISERKLAQERMEAINQKLQQKNHEMEQFIFTVSHDLKSPLVTISGFTNKLIVECAGVIDDKSLHRLNRIQSNIAHMGAILNDLLELSRIIRQEINIELCDVSSISQEICLSHEGIINESKAQVTLEKTTLKVQANRRLLTQALQNLLVNAIKYRHPERAPKIELTVSETPANFLVSVKDNGVGIASQYHERIFRIFERLDTGEGSGVGLAIVKTVMDKHHGKVELNSTPGIGSEFTLVFPKLRTEAKLHQLPV